MSRLKSHRYPQIYVHPFAPSGLFLLLFVMPRPYAFAVLSSVILHEMGHLTASMLYRKYPVSIGIMPTGISIGLHCAYSYTEEIVIAAAGPLMNLLYAAACIYLPYGIGGTARDVSLLLGTINLLPLAPLDGGRILSALLTPICGSEVCGEISNFFSLLLLAVLWVISLYIFFYSGVNFMLLLFCSYLFSYIVLKKL